jgi:cytoskeleton protein RodZ
VGEFGDKFRKAREKKELSYDDVSNVTKIGSRMLQAIEEEHFDLLPGGVFNKGFIRAYAKHLGLNDEEAVTDYLACLRQAQIDAHEVWEPERPRAAAPQPRPAVPERRRPVEPSVPPVKAQTPAQVEELPELQLPRAEDVRPRRRHFGDSSPEIPWRIVAVAAVVIVLGTILWTRRSHNTNSAAASTPPAKTVQESNPSPTPLPASTPAPANQPPQTLSTATTPEHSPNPNSQPPQGTPPPATTHPSNAAPTSSPSSEPDDKNDVTVRSFTKPNIKTPEKSAPTLTLVIRATETSWISVLADGQTVSQETLIAPAHASIRANHEIVARIGNAAGVTFLWNGQEIPADGAEAEVKTFVFDSTGMRVVPSTQPAPNN